MAKNKSAQPNKAVKSSKDSQVKSLSSVKQGAVTKPSQTPKSKSKEVAKQVAMKADKVDKKSKKAKKEPTPVSSDGSDSENDEDDSAGSVTSDEESEVEGPIPKKATTSNGIKTNGAAKAAAAADGESDSSDSSASSEDEDGKPKSVLKASTSAKKEPESDEDSEDSSEGSSDEEDAVDGAVDAKALNGKLAAVAPNDASSDEEGSDDDDSSSGNSEGSSSDAGSVEDAMPARGKRKAEAEASAVSKKAKTDPGNDDSAKKNLFVGHLSYNIDEEWLTREFETYGELSRVKVMTDRESGQSRGFGYVEYVNPADGVKAQTAMHEKEIDGRVVNVDFSKPRADAGAPRQDRQKTYGDNTSDPSDTIFVANLAFEATEDVVAEAFQKHGNVLGVRLPTDKDDGRPKGFGYVQFGTVEESQEVFGKMTGAVIMGRPIRLDYSSPRPPRDESGGRGGRGGGRGGRGGFDRGGRGGGRGRGGFDRGGGRGGRGGSTNRGGFGDFKGQKKTF